MDPSLYLDRDTWVHRLDPRTKIFLLLGMFALPFVFLNPLYELAVLALVLFFGYLAQSLANLRRIWFILLTILIVTTILWSIVGSGRTPLFLFVEREALLYGFSNALRIVITVIAGMIFLSTTRNEEVGIGLVRLGIPYRFAFAVSTALQAGPDGGRDGPDHRPGPEIPRTRPRIREHHPADPESPAAPGACLRHDRPLHERLLYGAGVQGVRGPSRAHVLPPHSHEREGRAGHGGVRGTPGRVHRAAGGWVRWTGRVQ